MLILNFLLGVCIAEPSPLRLKGNLIDKDKGFGNIHEKIYIIYIYEPSTSNLILSSTLNDNDFSLFLYMERLS